jgi:DNA-directed RNA polymerase subunit omega
MLPSPDILNNYEHGKFVLSNLAAKRAKQLREGAPQLVHCDSTHPLTIALAEIAAGKIKPIMPSLTESIPMQDDLPLLIDENMPAELGMLLPALDETEAALITTVGEEEAEADLLEGDDVLSLSDLVEEDEDVAAISSEDDTLSLSDIADQETAEDEEEPDEA